MSLFSADGPRVIGSMVGDGIAIDDVSVVILPYLVSVTR